MNDFLLTRDLFNMLRNFQDYWNCHGILDCVEPIQDFYEPLQESSASNFVQKIESCPVEHIKSSKAFKIVFKSGFSISYSGDTRFSLPFIDLSKNVDLMIHEATFENKMLQRANLTNHCTNYHALKSLKLSGAKFGILTHFSQRYDKCPVIENEVDGDYVDNFSIAYDNMMVNKNNFEGLREFAELSTRLINYSEEKDVFV